MSTLCIRGSEHTQPVAHNTTPPFSNSRPENSTSLMPRATSSSNRRRLLLSTLGVGVPAMRPCRNCTSVGKQCRVAGGSEKCIECVRRACPCDLASLDTSRYKRLESQRKKIEHKLLEAHRKQQRALAEQQEALSRQQRLLRQLEFVESEQGRIVEDEIRNIEELEQEETSSAPEPLIDVASEQVVFPNVFGDWSMTSLAPFDRTLEVPSGSLPDAP